VECQRNGSHTPWLTTNWHWVSLLSDSVHCGQPNISKPFIYSNFSVLRIEIEIHTQKMCKFVLNDIRSYPHYNYAHNLHIALIQGATKWLRQVAAQTLSRFTKQNYLSLSSPIQKHSATTFMNLHHTVSMCWVFYLCSILSLTPLLAVCVYEQQMAGV
jgi:hypothetical protein